MSFYDNLFSEMIGPDREEMLKVVDNDEELDTFLERLDEKRKMEMAAAGRGGRPASRVSKEDYVRQQTVKITE